MKKKSLTLILLLMAFGLNAQEREAFHKDSTKTENSTVKGIPSSKEKSLEENQSKIDDPMVERLKFLVKRKIQDLGDLLGIISDRGIKNEEYKRLAVDLICDMFVDEGNSSIIEVSRLDDPTPSVFVYELREYLRRVMLLPYSKIELKWLDISIGSSIYEKDSSSYNTKVVIEQVFVGEADKSGKAYQDLTTKIIDIEIRKGIIEAVGQKEETWDILFGRIGVQETQPYEGKVISKN